MTNIIIPTREIVMPGGRSPIVEQKWGVSARYKLQAINGEGCVTRESAWSNNKILGVGLDHILGRQSTGSTLTTMTQTWVAPVVGTGTAPVLFTNEFLAAFLAGATSGSIQDASEIANTTVAPYTLIQTRRFRFGQGAAAGNITEVGMAIMPNTTNAATNANKLLSRALVTDAMGQPTSVQVLQDEYLDVIWELTWYAPADSSGTFSQNINGVDGVYNYAMRASLIFSSTHWSSTSGGGSNNLGRVWANRSTSNNVSTTVVGTNPAVLGPATGEASSPGGGQSRITEAPPETIYTPGTYYRDVLFRMGLDIANGTVQGFNLSYTIGRAQMTMSPPVVKTAEFRYDITMRVALQNYGGN